MDESRRPGQIRAQRERQDRDDDRRRHEPFHGRGNIEARLGIGKTGRAAMPPSAGYRADDDSGSRIAGRGNDYLGRYRPLRRKHAADPQHGPPDGRSMRKSACRQLQRLDSQRLTRQVDWRVVVGGRRAVTEHRQRS